MTTDKKRAKLTEMCYFANHEFCTKCPLYKTADCRFEEFPDEEIDRIHNIVFPSTPTEPAIKDSGERRQFHDAEGKLLAVRDMSEGKGRMDLLPWAAIMEVSKHCENGAKKYGAHNVDKGLPTSSFADSATRHIAKWIDGWDDEPHLLAAAWNLLWAIQMELKHPELCDVPWKGADDEQRKAD
jgi:hypothetical protein